ncbi:glycosyl hydrolase family 35 [Spirochaetia bacterium]|nr:glycosyl hydrolase family 35 [Spirochaetia bacterium]
MKISNSAILDAEGRTLLLRGVNLGGGSKCPFGPPGWGLQPESLKNPENASFVGRPFPLEEAESHFERLNRAGLTFLRFIITWEALEHAGPGIYDEAYLAYLRKILLIAENKGISVFIDPHQDVWSRWTGGDGAPAWTLEKLGMDLEMLDRTGAALTRQRYGELHKSAKHPQGEPFPRMMWPSNYNRYAAATMFSLFFAGKTYAPNLELDGANIQDWLQERYIAAFRHCYRRLKNCGAIAGWGAMNEPHFGFIGLRDLEQAENPMVPVGPRPSPWGAMRAASGHTVNVPIYSAGSMGRKVERYETFNPEGLSLFKEGFSCPWKQAGVWGDENGEPRLLRGDHFAQYKGRQADFIDDFLKPFIIRFINKMKEADENTFFFIEGMPHSSQAASHPSWEKKDPPNTVNAFHWYDGFALFTKTFRPWFTIDPDNAKLIIGRKKVGAYFTKCLGDGITWTKERMQNMPCLLGEFGLAFDLNKRKAFAGGDYSIHEEALSMYYNAVDANLLHSTLWNYTADNTNESGDGWNDEDLSIFSEGKERAAPGWKRPYPMAVAGTPLAIEWNYKRRIFRCRFRADSAITAPTVIYLPMEFFGKTPEIKARTADATANIRWEYKFEEQRLFAHNDSYNGEVEIVVKGGPGIGQ